MLILLMLLIGHNGFEKSSLLNVYYTMSGKTIIRCAYPLRQSTAMKSVLLAFLLVFFVQSGLCANDVNEIIAVPKYSAKTSLQLNQEERQWLAAHKTIRVGYDGSLPPYSFINDQGKIDGIAVEIMAILSQRIGAEFVVYPDSNWNSLYRAAARRKVDVIAAMVSRPDRAKWFNFTKPYLTKSLVIVTRQDNTTINNRGDLNNKRIAVVKGYRYVEQISAEFPSATTVKTDSMLDSLKQVNQGNVDAAILFLGTANFLQAKHQLTQLKVASFFERNSADESIAVRKDWPKLAEILQKGLDSLTDEEVNKIFNKWVVQGGIAVANDAGATQAHPGKTVVSKPVANKQPVEIGQKPGVFSVPKTLPKPTPETLEIGKMVVVLLVVLTLFMLWFGLARKQKKQRVKVRNEMMVSARNLQSDQNEDMHLTIVPMLDEETPTGLAANNSTEPDVAAPITLDTQKLAQERLPEHFSSEQIQYQRDENGAFSLISPAITYVLGYSEAEFMSNYKHYLTDYPDNRKFDDFVETSIQGHPDQTCEIEIYDKGGDIHWLKVTGAAIYDGQGHCIGIQGSMHDITNEKLFGKLTANASVAESEAVIKTTLSHTFHERLLEAIQWADKGGTVFAVIFLSLERLRFLDGGLVSFPPEEVLKEASKRLGATLRDNDSIIELDADKFALVLPETDEQEANLIGEKIRKILQVPYLVGVQSIVLDTGMGFAVYPEHGREPEALIRKAQNTASVNPVELANVKKPALEDLSEDASLQLQQDLVYALDECKVALRSSSQNKANILNRHSQLAVHYQSRHNLSDYSIKGFEALVRWQHPELGMLLPRDFVDLVKDIGLLDVMTYWIIQQVSFQALAWEEKGIRPAVLSVNLGDLSIKQAVEVKKIAAIVNEVGAEPAWLMFSVHEKDFASNPKLVTKTVQQLVAAGFHVAIDKFSSEDLLPQIKALPVQVVEIDPTLIRYVPGGTGKAENITRYFDELHGTGKTVLAKEVESEKQLEFLKSYGCDIIQGHLLSRPLPANEAKELMANLPDFAWYLKQ